jgi:lysophospholipase L1-like esterase
MTWNRYVALGDSITEGYGMDPVEGFEPLPWVGRLARALNVEHHNLGRRNLRAAQIRETQLERALALEPDLVSIAAGPNDLLYDLDGIEAELEPLYAAFEGVDAFTFTYMDITRSGLLPDDGVAWLRPRMEELHRVVRRLAGRYGALVVDIYNHPESGRADFFSADLKHANARGHAFVAEQTLHALRTAKELQHA